MIPVQRPNLGAEELKAVSKVFDTRWLGMGATVKEFEDKIRDYTGAKHVIAVNTGTSALHIALDGLGLDPGDEVIVPSMTFVASIQAILGAGLKPVFCEIEPDTLNIDVRDAISRVTAKTKVIMPIHYGGFVCDMDAILEFARPRGIKVVEDAAHAYGSSYKGRKVGVLGDVTCFSFDPIKNITCGEGGAVTTDDDAIAARIIPKRILGIDNDTWSRYRNERNWFYAVTTPGYRYHMSNINAAIGLAQHEKLERFRAQKIAIIERYNRELTGLPGLMLLKTPLEEAFPFFYIVRVQNGRRDAMMKFLKARGVGTGVHYIPNHIQPLFAASKVSLPVTESVFEEMLTLPLHCELSDGDVSTVIAEVRAFLAENQ
ncbi:MAG: DegT/DnrJ/EryC1/StrS family aminotransferase [Acidobacteriota bacterium]